MDVLKLEFVDYDPGELLDEELPLPSKYAVVFLIEATGKLERQMNVLKASYISPILSHFRNAKKNNFSEMSRYAFAIFLHFCAVGLCLIQILFQFSVSGGQKTFCTDLCPVILEVCLVKFI
jgi:Mediator complex subunit 25 von Willebrand factor type A